MVVTLFGMDTDVRSLHPMNALAPMLDNLIKKINTKVVIAISIILVMLFTADNIYSSKYPNKGDGITRYKSDIKLNRLV